MQKEKFNLKNKRYNFDLIIESDATNRDEVRAEFYDTLIYSNPAFERFLITPNVAGKSVSGFFVEPEDNQVLDVTCTNEYGDLTLDAKIIETAPVGNAKKLCRFQIMNSIINNQMANKSITDGITPESFVSAAVDYFVKIYRKSLAKAVWTGDKSLDATLPFDGILTQLAAPGMISQIHIVSGYAPITTTNIFDKLTQTIKEATSSTYRPKMKGARPEDLVIEVASDVYLSIVAAAGLNDNNIMQFAGDYFVGKYKINEEPELPDNVILVRHKNAIEVAYSDDPNSGGVVRFVDMWQWLENEVRMKIQHYFGIKVQAPETITYYGPSLS